MGVLVWKRGVFRHIVGVLLFWGSWSRLCHWPTETWSKVNGAIFFCYLKSVLVICAYRRVHNVCTLCLLRTQGRRCSTQTCQILKIKGLQCKRILLSRLHKYKNAYIMIVIACIRIRLPICSRMSRSVSSLRRVRSFHLQNSGPHRWRPKKNA